MSDSPGVSLSQAISITCPECGREFTADVWMIVDVQQRSDLAELATAGTLSSFRCPGEHTIEVHAPLLLYLPGRDPPLLFSPPREATNEDARQQAASLLELLHQRLGPAWQNAWLEQGIFLVPPELIPATLAAELETSPQQAAETGAEDVDLVIPAPEVSVEAGTWDTLVQRYLRTQRLTDLDAAIAALRQTLEVTPEGNVRRAQMMDYLSSALWDRYTHTDSPADLDAAIAAYGQAANLTPEGNPRRAALLTDFGSGLRERYAMASRLEDLDAAITAFRQALELTPTDVPERPALSSWLGAMLLRRYFRTGELEDLLGGIEACQQALDLSPEGDPERAGILTNLSTGLQARYAVTARLEDLDALITTSREALGLTPEDAPGRLILLSNLGSALWDRYGHTDSPEDLDAAINDVRQAVDLAPVDHPHRPAILTSLGKVLRHRYSLTGCPENLDAAIAAYGQAVNLTPEGDPRRAALLTDFGSGLRERYAMASRLEDLDAAITAFRQALELGPEDHAERAKRLSWLGRLLWVRYKRTGREEDLDAALAACREAYDLTPEGHLDRAERLIHLGVVLSDRYECTGREEDLEATLAACQQALDLAHQDDSDRPVALNGLGMGLWRRYARTGSPEDLDAAVAVFQEAIALAPQSDPERANYLNSLGNALWDRYSRTGRVEDLEAAVAAYWQALDLTPEGAEGRPNHLTNLGKALRDRYNLTGSPEDLDRAISLCQEAVDVTPEGTLSRAIYLSNLGVALCDRYSLTSTPEDLSAAIAAYQQALDLTPEGAPTRANFLSSLGGALFSRYSLSDTPEDLDAAVVACQEAVDVTPEGTPSRANFLYNLGSALRHRYSLAGTPEDLRAAIVAWQAAREELHASMLSGLEIAQLAVRASLITRRLVQAYLDQDDAATALVALETGKALGLRMELARTHRMPINLTPAESAEYQNLTRQARLIPSQRRALSPVLHAEELTGLGRRYREALARLRELEARDPNFAVRAPDYPALRMVAARHGLVLVFLQPTDDRARGTLVFLVHPASPPLAPAEEDLLSLTGLTSEDLHRLLLRLPPGIEWKQEALPKILATGQGGEPLGWLAAYWLMHLTHRPPYDLQARALWEATLMRVLGELGTRLAGILAPRLRRLGVRRVVLFPSHPLGLLPLHAAPVSEGTDQALGDEFEISYAPSATALMRCLECSHRRGEQSAPSFAAVANPDGSLVFADDEVDSISRRFGGQVRVAHGPAATKEWLLGVAPEADFLELSTHASFDPDNPARSKMLLAHPGGHTAPRWLAAEATQRLPLADLQAECERLTLDDLWAGRLRLKEGCVVTASACETGQVDPHTRSEESPGFPAAFLGAGASGVVASLWAVNDLSTALLMEKTYEQMLPPHRFRPAEALQHAAGWLRNLSREEVLARLESLIQALRHQEQEGLWDALDATELAARHYRLALLMRCRIDVKVGPERAFAHPVYWAPFCAYGA